MDKQKFKNLLIKTAIDYIKIYNLTSEDVIVINGFIQELLSKLGIEED